MHNICSFSFCDSQWMWFNNFVKISILFQKIFVFCMQNCFFIYLFIYLMFVMPFSFFSLRSQFFPLSRLFVDVSYVHKFKLLLSNLLTSNVHKQMTYWLFMFRLNNLLYCVWNLGMFTLKYGVSTLRSAPYSYLCVFMTVCVCVQCCIKFLYECHKNLFAFMQITCILIHDSWAHAIYINYIENSFAFLIHLLVSPPFRFAWFWHWLFWFDVC